MKSVTLLVLSLACTFASAKDLVLYCDFSYQDTWRLTGAYIHKKLHVLPGEKKPDQIKGSGDRSFCVWEFAPKIDGGLSLEFSVWIGTNCANPVNGYNQAQVRHDLARGTGAGLSVMFPPTTSDGPVTGMALYRYLMTREDELEMKKDENYRLRRCYSLLTK